MGYGRKRPHVGIGSMQDGNVINLDGSEEADRVAKTMASLGHTTLNESSLQNFDPEPATANQEPKLPVAASKK